MDNPFKKIRKFVNDRARQAARTAVERLDPRRSVDRETEGEAHAGRDSPIERGAPGRGAPGPRPHREPDRDASVAFGRHEDRDRKVPESAVPGTERTEQRERRRSRVFHGEDEQRRSETPSGEAQTDDDATDGGREEVESTGSAEQGPEAEESNKEEPVGVLFDEPPRSIQTLRPADDPEGTDGRRRHETRHVFVSTGEWNGGGRSNGRQDVRLDVSELELDKLQLQVDDLDAQVALHASVAELVDVSVGADVQLGGAELDIEDVEAEALLEVDLGEIRHILDRALQTIENRPELVIRALETAETATEQVEETAENATDEIGDTAGDVAEQTGELGKSATRNVSEEIEDPDLTEGTESGEENVGPSISAGSRAEYDESSDGEKS